MRKYKHKYYDGKFVFAEILHKGMQDGFICYESCNMEYRYKCEDCHHYLPYINTPEGAHQFVFGDYLLTDIKTGKRYSLNANAFLSLYEEVV